MDRRAVFTATVMAAAFLGAIGFTTADERRANDLTFRDSTGVQQTMTTAGAIDANNPFFQDIGTNGRACFSCHRPDEGWTVTPDDIQRRFNESRGLDPIFRTNDGSNCEGADISTVPRRRKAFSMLLSKGLIRVGMAVPSNAEFEIVDVSDPYSCGSTFNQASLYRRPLPSTNLRFLSTVMWDGRETAPGRSIRDDLASQAFDATMGHAQGAPPAPDQVNAIVDFELGLFTAQIQDHRAGGLRAHGADGGPSALMAQPFCLGINDPLNILPSTPGACAVSSGGLNPAVFTAFSSWNESQSESRRAIARGEAIFNSRRFVIDNVGGLNAGPGDPVAGPMVGTCTVCHDSPGAGSHSVAMPLDIGVADASRRTPDLPLYTLENRITHDIRMVTDPGRAMVTGKWADIGKFKGPTLRALAVRAPYFHNGSAATLEEVVDFYDQRFHMNLSRRERADLVRFLSAL
jgi:cytochrome c peroxidase